MKHAKWVVAAADDTLPEARFRLIVYVMEDRSIDYRNDIGWATYRQVYINSPSGARFTVLENRAHQYLAIDMWETELTRNNVVKLPKPDIYSDADQAIAAVIIMPWD